MFFLCAKLKRNPSNDSPDLVRTNPIENHAEDKKLIKSAFIKIGQISITFYQNKYIVLENFIDIFMICMNKFKR